MVKEEKTITGDGEDEHKVTHVARAQEEDGSSLQPSSTNANEVAIIKQMPLVATERSPMETKSTDSSSIQKSQRDEQLKSTKAKVGKVREENERLKLILARIMKEYQSLQTHFFDIVQNEANKSTSAAPTHLEDDEEPELVSLSLGRVTSEARNEKKNSNPSKGTEDKKFSGGLALGLDCKFDADSTEVIKNSSPENSFEDHEPKEADLNETWPPSKILKTARSGDDAVLQQTHLKKARVSVRARCNTPTMNDGCQWRKYGQKVAKGNPCPRAYYRCTISPSCPVRKQVQRCADDMSILITTYEGTHNHPLPIAATAIASTTSVAASMLQSGSSSSTPGLEASATTAATSVAANLHELNFTISQNSRSQQFYLPNFTISTAHHSHPTITLDLTTPASSSHFSSLSSSFTSAPRYSSTSLSFSSYSSSSSVSSTPQTSWGSEYLSSGALSYNMNQMGSLNLGRQPLQEHFHHPYMQKSDHSTPSQQSLTETIAAATKVITANPTFRSALATALTPFVGKGVQENQGGRENSGLNLMRWVESFPVNHPYPSTTQNMGIGCAPSYLSRSLSLNSQHGSLISFPPSLPLSSAKSASASTADDRDQTK